MGKMQSQVIEQVIPVHRTGAAKHLQNGLDQVNGLYLLAEEPLSLRSVGFYQVLSQGSEHDQAPGCIHKIEHLRRENDLGDMAKLLPGPASQFKEVHLPAITGQRLHQTDDLRRL